MPNISSTAEIIDPNEIKLIVADAARTVNEKLALVKKEKDKVIPQAEIFQQAVINAQTASARVHEQDVNLYELVREIESAKNSVFVTAYNSDHGQKEVIQANRYAAEAKQSAEYVAEVIKSSNIGEDAITADGIKQTANEVEKIAKEVEAAANEIKQQKLKAAEEAKASIQQALSTVKLVKEAAEVIWLQEAVRGAVANYGRQDKLNNVSRGFLTYFRHGQYGTDEARTFRTEVDQATTVAGIVTLCKNYISPDNSKHHGVNNHSFVNYLREVLGEKNLIFKGSDKERRHMLENSLPHLINTFINNKHQTSNQAATGPSQLVS